MRSSIIFSTDMVKAYIDNRKTQTRRLTGLDYVNQGPDMWIFVKAVGDIKDNDLIVFFENIDSGQIIKILFPYKNKLWVRETWCGNSWDGFGIYYKANHVSIDGIDEPKWKPSIFMPRWASRFTIALTNIRVERLQDITIEDCIAEGIIAENFYPDDGYPLSVGFTYIKGDVNKIMYPSPEEAFQKLWDSINAKRGYSWESNPYVWVLEFKKC